MDYSLVEVDGGFIKGEILTNVLNEDPYCSFKGVPYACPPVGPLRFQPPKPVKKWEGVRQCVEDGDGCWQKMIWAGPDPPAGGSEDCLYLNIFFPVENVTKGLRPVMVFIHGGGFETGSGDSNMYGPDFLIAKGVVLVTINYRLNVLGFLNLGIKECPGNAGLKDQRAALIWVKKHISKFTGDPENITLFGESAGSASVDYHLLSPLSKGLYHKAILESGCSLDRWAYIDTEVSINRAFRLGKHLGCITTDVRELHTFLLSVPAKTLVEALPAVFTPEDTKYGLPFAFLPSKEIVGAYEDRFLPSDPKTLHSKAPEVPILIGLNSSEGHIFYLESPRKLQRISKNAVSLMDNMFPLDLKNLAKDPSKVKLAKSKVRQFYLKDASADSIVASKFSEFFGDITFGRGHHKWLKVCLSFPMLKPIYVYQFDFESKVSLFTLFGMEIPDFLSGSCHADELMFLFNFRAFNHLVLPSEVCMRVVESLTTIWTNFAKFGNPNVEPKINWKPISPSQVSHCKIGKELVIQPGFIHEERLKFWNELHLSMLSQSKL